LPREVESIASLMGGCVSHLFVLPNVAFSSTAKSYEIYIPLRHKLWSDFFGQYLGTLM